MADQSAATNPAASFPLAPDDRKSDGKGGPVQAAADDCMGEGKGSPEQAAADGKDGPVDDGMGEGGISNDQSEGKGGPVKGKGKGKGKKAKCKLCELVDGGESDDSRSFSSWTSEEFARGYRYTVFEVDT